MAYNGRAPKRPKMESMVAFTVMDNSSNGSGLPSRTMSGNFGPGDRGERRRDVPENHILLFTILQPAYPITVDVLHKITQAFGEVLRIVVFKKHGVQAMVEFDQVQSAKTAKESLDGADIYSGCCTLKIDYAKPTRLNVYKNDSETWDYTTPSPSKESRPRHQGPLLQEPVFGASTVPYRGGEEYRGHANVDYGGERMLEPRFPPRGGGASDSGRGHAMRYPRGYYDDPYRPGAELHGSRDGNGHVGGRGGAGGGPPFAPLSRVPPSGLHPEDPRNHSGEQGCVLILYSLNPDKMDPDRVFNLLCLYGNVVKAKFLKTKSGSAMVQMSDPAAVERAIAHLNNTTFFGSKMQLGHSKQVFLAEVQQPYDLPNENPSFKNFSHSKNNRFSTPELASKNRIQSPTKVLHFFNFPPTTTEDDIRQHFTNANAPLPIKITLFVGKSERSCSGLAEFDSIAEAVEVLVICNHIPVPNPNGKFPYISKLCFSTARSDPEGRIYQE